MRADGSVVGVDVTGGALPVAGAGARCPAELDRRDAGAQVRAEIARWRTPGVREEELDGLALARAVTREVRWTGTHALDPSLLADLADVRARHRGRDAALDAFLDCALAKHDDRYWNRTYLCLPVLERLVDGPGEPLDPVALAALLAADVVRHELCASRRDKAVGPLDRPDERTLRTRVRQAVRFLTANLGAPTAAELLAGIAHDPEAGLPEILARLPVAPECWAADWLELTVLPVSTVHDEYFFIRALQAHETVYGVAARRVAAAAAALDDDRPADAAALVDRATALVERGQSLFRMVATLRYEAFHTFREFTDGASAIQSEQYKRFEARCGTPPAHRLGCPAFESVPAVAAELARDTSSLAGAWLAARDRSPADLAGVTASMAALEAAHRRWKGTHLGVAARMLGDAGGSGGTSGVSYLRSWVDHRLFWALGDAAATG
ncbi:hypothetical protein ACI797_07310 [Geodermatophilus sp. SYSU D00691]